MAFETGALKDPPDPRDYRFADTRLARAAIATLPDFAMLMPWHGPVKNQSPLGACVAFACASARELLVRKLDDASQALYSPLYLYYRGRELSGLLGQDGGMYLRDGVKALAQWGVPTENQYPYEPEHYNRPPSELIDTWADQRRIYSYHRIDQPMVEGMRQALASGYPVVVSFPIWGDLIGPRLVNDVLQMPDDKPSLGGHAVLVVGYSHPAETFLCQNSWGPEWARDGMFWVPYQYLEQYGWDAWMMLG